MVKMKGLGRGLDALLAGNSQESHGDSLQTLPIDQLQPGKYQPRTLMDQDSLAELSASIKSQGIMQPILVRPLAQGYEIIAGERRWRAARLAGLSEVPVMIRDVPDEAALAMSLIENIQRENLNPLEEAQGIQRLVNEFSMTHEKAAEAVGRSRSAVSNLLRLLNLAAPVQDLLAHNKLEMGHARALLPLSNAAQIQAGQEIASKQLSVREAERMVKQLLSPVTRVTPQPDRDILHLQEGLAEKLGARVTVKAGTKGKGKLIIDYASLEQLDSIIGKLG
jgi:ParB family transcriptional regulator, chromosome partitioning protein